MGDFLERGDKGTLPPRLKLESKVWGPDLLYGVNLGLG